MTSVSPSSFYYHNSPSDWLAFSPKTLFLWISYRLVRWPTITRFSKISFPKWTSTGTATSTKFLLSRTSSISWPRCHRKVHASLAVDCRSGYGNGLGTASSLGRIAANVPDCRNGAWLGRRNRNKRRRIGSRSRFLKIWRRCIRIMMKWRWTIAICRP